MVRNGWSLYFHPLFLDQVEELIVQVEKHREKDPTGYSKKNATKRLAAIRKLTIDVIPQDPAKSDYRQGETLGGSYKHWFRAKFFQQYRIFFRYHAKAKIIVYAWVNDEASKRAYTSKTDAYRVFARMLNQGNPPDNWEALVHESKENQGCSLPK